jgi:hypothetical protein
MEGNRVFDESFAQMAHDVHAAFLEHLNLLLLEPLVQFVNAA